MAACRRDCRKVCRLTPIAPAIEQIANRRNLPVKSRARILDGSGDAFSPHAEKICAEKSARYRGSEQSSGNDFGPSGAILQRPGNHRRRYDHPIFRDRLCARNAELKREARFERDASERYFQISSWEVNSVDAARLRDAFLTHRLCDSAPIRIGRERWGGQRCGCE